MIRSPDEVGDLELLRYGRTRRVSGESVRRERRPRPHVDLHAAVIARRVAAPIRDAVPVDRFVPVDTASFT